MSTTTATELWRMSATELAEAIRSKRASSREVIEAQLRRIEAANPAANAVTTVLAEQAIEAAKAADRVVASGADLPRFHGVPFTIKGNIDLLGTPTSQGLKALAGAYPSRDAPVAERLKAAGALEESPGAPRSHSPVRLLRKLRNLTGEWDHLGRMGVSAPGTAPGSAR